MGVNVVITDRKVFNQYANAPDLGSNLTNYTSYLRGGVMNVQKAVYTVEVSWFELWLGDTTGNLWSVDGNVLIRNQGSWVTEGFSIGDKIDLGLGVPLAPVFADRIITNITDDRIYFDGTAVAATDSDLGGYLDAGKTDLHGLEYSFGIIPNQDNPFFSSLLDNSNQTYYADNIGVGGSTAFVTLQAKTQSVKGWDTSRVGNSKVKFLSRPSTYIQEFEIHHEYIINPYTLPNLLSGNKSYKYVSKFDFRLNVNNVNTAKVAIDDLQSGSVGDFNENYNGYVNDFTVSDLVYTDVASASTSTSLNLSSKTKVEFNVSSASGLFTIGDPVCVFHSFIPTKSEYNKSALIYRDGWVFRSNRVLIDDPASDFDGILQLDVNYVDANNITVSYETEYTSDERLLIGEGSAYKLGCEVGDGDLANQTLNVTLLVDEDVYLDDKNITGLIVSDGFGFNPYYKFIAPTADLFTTYFGWVEDEIISWHRIGVNRTAAKDAKILGAQFKIVAYEDATGETFDLQNEQLDLSGELTVPSTNPTNPSAFDFQLINDNRTRGYNLPLGDEFNLLLFETDDEDATYKYYEWRVGFKMNWQYWVSLPDADNIFIDSTDTFNGKNNRASNYSLKNGWSIRTIWSFDMQGIDDDGNVGETTKNFVTDAHSIYDFMAQDDDPTTWECKQETFDENGNLLGTSIDGVGNAPVLYGETTFIKDTYTPLAPFVIADILPYWAEGRIAEQLQQGFDNGVLSTTKPYKSDNRIIPLEGESFAKITLVSNTIVVEYRTNVSKIKKNTPYKLSQRMANQDEPIQPIEWIFKTESNIPADATFDPSVIASGGELPTWTLIGGYTRAANLDMSIATRTSLLGVPTSLVASELNGICQDVSMTFSTNDPSNIDEMDFGDNQICEDLDFSLFTDVSELMFDNNNIESVIPPPSSLTTFRFENNSITSVLDMSPVSDFPSNFRVQSNSITNITILASNTVIAFFYADDNNITGTQDLRGLTSLGGDFDIRTNTLMTGLLLPISSNTFSDFICSGCDLLTLNLSTLTGFGGNVRMGANNNLSSVTFPVSPVVFSFLLINDCNLSVADVSGLSKIGGTIRFDNNILTSITLPVSSTTKLNSWRSDNNLHGYIDLSIFGSYNTNTFVNVANNFLTAANVQSMIDDLDGVLSPGATIGVLSFGGQTPALTAPQISAIQLTATYLSLTATKGYTINL